MNALFDHSENVTASITTFWFKPEGRFRYTAGQFTELTLPHDNPDDRGSKRWFTLSSSPTDTLISITTRFAAEQSSTFKRAMRALEPGARVHIEEAMGDFVLPKLTQTPVVFVAGGIGITPFHSIMRWLADTGENRPTRLLWAVKNEDDIIWQDVIDAAGIHATIAVSKPSDSWGGVRGRLTADMILGIEKPSDDTLIYLSGPEPMLEALKSDLLGKGVAARQIVTDFFPGYTSL